MAKDPAVLWYFSDWGSGTRTLTRHQKGCYMDLLEAQFNSGPLSLEEIKTVLGNDFAAWGVLSKKFKASEEGLFSNERLESEKSKRKSFVESRRSNLQKKPPHMAPHMESHTGARMENRNRNRNRNEDLNLEGDARGRKVFSQPSLEEIQSYCLERGSQVDPQAFLDHYESNGWKVGKNPMKDWRAAIRTWERNSSEFSRGGSSGSNRRYYEKSQSDGFEGIREFAAEHGVELSDVLEGFDNPKNALPEARNPKGKGGNHVPHLAGSEPGSIGQGGQILLPGTRGNLPGDEHRSEDPKVRDGAPTTSLSDRSLGGGGFPAKKVNDLR